MTVVRACPPVAAAVAALLVMSATGAATATDVPGPVGGGTPVQPVTSFVPVGTAATALAIDSAARTVWVADETGRAVRSLDSDTGAITATVGDHHEPRDIALDTTAHRLYAANEDSTISVIDTDRAVVTSTIAVDGGPTSGASSTGPYAIAVDASRSRAYTANADGTVSVIDTATGTLVTDLDIGDPSGAKAIAVDPASGAVYAFGFYGNPIRARVSRLDPATLTVGADYDLGYASGFFAAEALDRTRETLYAYDGTLLFALDLSSGAVTDLARNTPTSLAVDPMSGQLYEGDGLGLLRVFPVSTSGVAGVTPTPVALDDGDDAAADVAVDPASGTAYVAERSSGRVAILRPTLLRIPPTATPGRPYDFAFAATGLGAPTTTVSSGSLPPGISLSAEGRLSGTPAAAGRYRFTVTASGAGRTATTAVSLLVAASTPLRPNKARYAVGEVYDDARGNVILADRDRKRRSYEVSAVAATTGQFVKRAVLPGGITGLAADAAHVFVTDPSGVDVLDPVTLKTVATVPFDSPAGAIVVDPTAHIAYVGSGSGVVLLDTTTYRTLGSISLPDGAGSLALDPGRRRLYALGQSNRLQVVDLSTRSIAAVIVIDPYADGFTLPAPQVVADTSSGHVFVTRLVSYNEAVTDVVVVDESGVVDGPILARTPVIGTVPSMAADPAGGVDVLVDAAFSLGPLGYVAQISASGRLYDGYAVPDHPVGLALAPSGQAFVLLDTSLVIAAAAP